ncbi:MAG: amino acid ABC transporter ATP-binding protein [Pyramidobacter sp.]
MIEIKNLKKQFGSLQVLKGINLTIHDGEVVSIIGPSGSGKSTLLRCINLLEQPTSGQVIIDGQDITARGVNIQKVREEVGMVFQHFNLFQNKNVMQNMIYAPMKVRGIPKEQAEQKAMQLLERVGLADKAQAYPSMLSGGQQQRVAIARALAMEPKTLLFDEPTSALDPEMVKEVLDVIRSLVSTGITMAIVTHEMNFAREASDRICFVDQGIIAEEAPPAEFFSAPKTERARSFLDKIL